MTLTPDYDLCPQLRSGQAASQAMAIGRGGERDSQLRVCLDAAPVYHLTQAEAADIIDHQLTVINEQWAEAADTVQSTELDQQSLWKRQILDPSISYGYPRTR